MTERRVIPTKGYTVGRRLGHRGDYRYALGVGIVKRDDPLAAKVPYRKTQLLDDLREFVKSDKSQSPYFTNNPRSRIRPPKEPAEYYCNACDSPKKWEQMARVKGNNAKVRKICKKCQVRIFGY